MQRHRVYQRHTLDWQVGRLERKLGVLLGEELVRGEGAANGHVTTYMLRNYLIDTAIFRINSMSDDGVLNN